MATKGFENKDSKSDRPQDGKQSGGANIDVLGLLMQHKDIQKGINDVNQTVQNAVAGLQQLFGQADKSHEKTAAQNKTHEEFKRGSLLNAGTHDHIQRGALAGRLVHNEAPHHNPSHISAFLLKRLHERETTHHAPEATQQQVAFQSLQSDRQPIVFSPNEQFNQQERGTDWQEANFAARRSTADVTLAVFRPVASALPGSEFNPNTGADEQMLKQQGLPYTRSIDRDIPGVWHVVHGVMTRNPEKFHSQMSQVGQGPFHATARANDGHHHQQGNLPYGGFQQHARINYYQAENNYYKPQRQLPYGGFRRYSS